MSASSLVLGYGNAKNLSSNTLKQREHFRVDARRQLRELEIYLIELAEHYKRAMQRYENSGEEKHFERAEAFAVAMKLSTKRSIELREALSEL